MDKINRIIDANCNRTREGLRVIEEIIRFWLENAPSFHTIKQLRHHFTALETQIRSQLTHVMTARQSDQDVGKHYIPNLEANRTDIVSLAEANCRRVEESLRVLEEFLKLTDVTVIKEVKELRFTIYELEKHLKHELTQQ